MRKDGSRFVSILVATLLLGPLACGQGKGNRKYQAASGDRTPLGVVVVFTPQEREIINDWFWKNRTGLPPGLAKRDSLPPGLQKQLQRNGSLPPGLQKKLIPLPYALDSRLERLPLDILRVVIGNDVILLNRRNNIILDMISGVIRNPDPNNERQYQTHDWDNDDWDSRVHASRTPVPVPAPNNPVAHMGTSAESASTSSTQQSFQLKVRMTQSLSTETAHAGDHFTATLEEAVYEGNRVVARKGALAEGQVVDSDKGGRVKGVASLTVKLLRFRMTSGKYAEISSDPVIVDANSTKGKDATKIALTSGIGAGIGALLGGGKGAAVGAASGAATGTGVVLATRGDPAVIPNEGVLEFAVRSY